MEYKEFERRVKELGYHIERDMERLDIVTQPSIPVARIYDDEQYDLDISYPYKLKEELFDLVVEYARTPVEKRRERKYNVVAYRRKYGKPNGITEKTYFYWIDEDCFLRTRSGGYNDDPYQQWTLSQIEEYGLEDCERIGV